MSVLDQAKEFAIRAHNGMTYGKRHYSCHLNEVEAVLIRFGVASMAMRCAAWLHDVVEDTPITIGDIRTSFPVEVARLVEAVTDCAAKNRSERKALTYAQIWVAGADAVALKLADRIANAEASLQWNPQILSMYRREHEAFREALYVAGENEEMWAHLEDLLRKEVPA